MGQKFKIKKGDTVQVLAGKDKGKTGAILKIIRDADRVLVAGINMVKRHQAPSAKGNGGIIESERSIHVSNVALVDPKENKPTRVGFKQLENGQKVRIAKRSGEVIA